MPLTQHGLKATLHDLKMICRHQFFLAQTIHGFNHPAIEAATFDVKNTFREFDRSEVWMRPLEYDPLRLIELMIELDRVQVFNLQHFTDIIHALTDFLQNEILAPPVAVEAAEEVAADESDRGIDSPTATEEVEETTVETAVLPTDFNQKVLNQLVINQRNIRNKERVFKRKGEDLPNNVDYQNAKANCRRQIRQYRTCLKNNAVDSVATDVIIFEEIGQAIKIVHTVPLFTKVIEKYASVVTTKLPTPVDPEPVDPVTGDPVADGDNDPTDPPPSDV